MNRSDSNLSHETHEHTHGEMAIAPLITVNLLGSFRGHQQVMMHSIRCRRQRLNGYTNQFPFSFNLVNIH